MDVELEGILSRAQELLEDLEDEYKKSLSARTVTERARNLSHEVLEKLRSALDQTMHRAWEKYVAPNLTEDQRRRSRVYFPVASDLESFQATLGRGQMADLDRVHGGLYGFLLGCQPFSSADNLWLDRLAKISNEGKHLRLTPQKRQQTRRIRVSGTGGGSVSWDPSSVRFGPGVRIMGAPVDPATQRTVSTPGVTEQVEMWVSFVFEDYGVDALGFCKEAYHNTRALVGKMVDSLSLS